VISRIRQSIWPRDTARRFLTLLLALFACTQLLIVIIFPPFSGHDEVAHFDYARLIAQEQRLPLIPELETWRAQRASGEPVTGDFLASDLYPYCLFALEWWPCEPDNPERAANPPYEAIDSVTGDSFPIAWQYAANHPPLFYVLAAPVQWLLDGQGLGVQNRVLRLLAIPFGALVVAGTFALARRITPQSGFVPVVAATGIAFQPQVAYSAAIFNNDVTVIAAGVWLLVLLMTGIRRGFDRRLVVGAGLLLGVGLLLKGTMLVFAPVVALALIAGTGWRQIGVWLPKGLVIAGIGFGMASPWYLYLWRTYGNLSGLEQVAQLQALWNYPNGAPGFAELLTDGAFIQRFWRELWGGYGWRRIPFEDGLLIGFGLVCLFGVVGLGMAFAHGHQRGGAAAVQGLDAVGTRQATVLVASVGLAYLAVIQFGTTFELAQARYVFPALPAAAVLLAIGVSAIVPSRARRYALVLWVAGALAVTVFIYSAYVIPYWYLGADR
jgi:4-amino-4-deoxy-L-arabinose transferase-like glycosyltransferase